MTASEKILSEAKRIYDAAELGYRDALLEIGRLLHRFILEYLKENTDNRRTGTREEAVIHAAKSLSITARKAGNMIRTAMVVELLSDNGEVGSLGYGTIYRLTRLVERCMGDGHPGRDRPRETAEEWKIVGNPDEAKRLFRAAVAEGVPQSKIKIFVGKGKSHERECGVVAPKFSDTLASLKPMARGSPRDVAEILFEIVKESDDPAAIVGHLSEMVKQIPKRRAS